MKGKVDLSSFKNPEFDRGAGFVKILLWLVIDICFVRNPINFSVRIKTFLLRAFGAKIGSGVILKPGIHIKYPWKLKVGNDVWIGEKVWIDNLALVTIENNVCISQGAFLLTGNHDYKKSSFDLILGPIVLEEGVWIGAKSIVCPGVTCMKYSVLAVGSVATEDLEAETIYQGNPALAKRKRW